MAEVNDYCPCRWSPRHREGVVSVESVQGSLEEAISEVEGSTARSLRSEPLVEDQELASRLAQCPACMSMKDQYESQDVGHGDGDAQV